MKRRELFFNCLCLFVLSVVLYSLNYYIILTGEEKITIGFLFFLAFIFSVFSAFYAFMVFEKFLYLRFFSKEQVGKKFILLGKTEIKVGEEEYFLCFFTDFNDTEKGNVFSAKIKKLFFRLPEGKEIFILMKQDDRIFLVEQIT